MLGRSEGVAQKPKKNGKKKKPASRARAKTAKPSSPAAKSRPVERSRSPLYVLVIMGLATAIVLMVNKHDSKKGQRKESPPHETSAVRDAGREKPEAEKKHEDTIEKKDTSEKIEKREKPEKAEKIGAPVKPETGQEKKQAEKPEEKNVRIYLVKLNEESEKMYLAPVGRKVSGGSVLENTIQELIKGPTASEKKKGMLTAVPPSLRVNGVKIRNNVAEIDFNGAIEQGAAGNVLINRIDQIVYTATQFPNVRSVVIKINGRARQTLGTDGLSIGGPLHRRQ